jgi:predicted RNA methylase
MIMTTYTTPQKIMQYILLNILIQNPPYGVRGRHHTSQVFDDFLPRKKETPSQSFQRWKK